MNKSWFLLPLASLILTNCGQGETEKPKVTYRKDASTKQATVADSAQIMIADLPVRIPGTDVLLHPIGEYRVYDGSRRTGYTYERGSFKISNYSEYEITGFLKNIRLEKMGTDSTTAFFEKPVMIQTATFLNTFAAATKQQLMVFSVSDMDTNQDGKLDANDVKTLYLGSLDGMRTSRVSPDYQELIDWNFIEGLNRLYFRTIEDTNKSGEFDKDDVIHYHYLDLMKKDWMAVEYRPI